MSFSCFSEWLGLQTNHSIGDLDRLLRDRVLLDVSIDVLKNGGTQKSVSFVQDFNQLSQPVQLFDALYQNASGLLTGVLVAPNLEGSDDFVQKWIAFAVSNSAYLDVKYIEVRDLSGVLVSTVDVASLDISDASASVAVEVSEESLDSMNTTDLAQNLAMWRLLAQDATQTSKKIEQLIAQRLDKKQLDDQGVDFGIARSKINKIYDVEKIDQKVTEIMKVLEYPEVEILKNYNNHPNFWIDAKFDSELLIDLVALHLGVDIRQDDRFSDAVTQQKTPNVPVRLEYLENLAKNADIEVKSSDFVDWDESEIKTELIRESLTGSARHVRSNIVAALQSKMKPLIHDAGQQYSAARQHVINAQPRKKSARKKR